MRGQRAHFIKLLYSDFRCNAWKHGAVLVVVPTFLIFNFCLMYLQGQ